MPLRNVFHCVQLLTFIPQVQYFCPLDSVAREKFENMWDRITIQYGGRVASTTIPVMFGRYLLNISTRAAIALLLQLNDITCVFTRTLEVPESCNGVARFTFEHLCGRPVSCLILNEFVHWFLIPIY